MPESAVKPRRKKPAPADEQQRQVVEQAIQEGRRLAESRLDIARLFLSRGQFDIARRRLTELLQLHPDTEEAQEAKQLLADGIGPAPQKVRPTARQRAAS